MQLAHELYTRVYSVRLELEEVETAADGRVARFAGEVDEFCERASNLHQRGCVSTFLLHDILPGIQQILVVACSFLQRTRHVKHTYIECNVAHDCGVVWKPNVMRIVLVVFALRGARLLLVDNEGALHIDAHIAGMQDRLLDVALNSRPPRSSKHGRRRTVRMLRMRTWPGFTRRGVHVCGG